MPPVPTVPTGAGRCAVSWLVPNTNRCAVCAVVHRCLAEMHNDVNCSTRSIDERAVTAPTGRLVRRAALWPHANAERVRCPQELRASRPSRSAWNLFRFPCNVHCYMGQLIPFAALPSARCRDEPEQQQGDPWVCRVCHPGVVGDVTGGGLIPGRKGKRTKGDQGLARGISAQHGEPAPCPARI